MVLKLESAVRVKIPNGERDLRGCALHPATTSVILAHSSASA